MTPKHLTSSNCEVCILAGGLSSRMGRDKARLRIGRRTLLGHVRATAAALGFRVRVIRQDVVPRCGPLGGILTGLLSARAETVLFLSCDMPFVSTRLLRQLITALEQSTSLRGVFARTGNTVGFPLVVRRDIVTDVEKLIAAKELSLQGLARRLKGKSIKVPTSRARELTNINTPEDLERVRHSSPRTA